ncbi:MAG: hypothetical protein IKR08_01410 [Firmicutes bacterium]|nr:hypothetical protein [Bacillota bacterium]
MDRKWGKEDTGMFRTEQRRIAIGTFIKYGHNYADTIAENCIFGRLAASTMS